jgi:hypothetical protein
MEQACTELAVVEEAVVAATEAQLSQLRDLELAFVGGGTGEVTPF